MKIIKAFAGSAFITVFLCVLSWALLSLVKLTWESVFSSPSPFLVDGVEILLGALMLHLAIKMTDWSEDD